MSVHDVVHPVEKQWHYPIMTKYGFKPQDLSGVGLVRFYKYTKDNVMISCHTGVHQDYFIHGSKTGIWSELENYIKEMKY